MNIHKTSSIRRFAEVLQELPGQEEFAGPYRPKNGPDRYLTRKNRCNLYLTDALGSQIVEILILRVQYVTTLLRNRRNPQLTRSLLISARAKKVVPARLLNLGR